MAIVGYVDAVEQSMLEAESRLAIVGSDSRAIPFVVPRLDGIADCGYASAGWIIHLYKWLVQTPSIPEIQQHRIRGMLLGYSSAAIRDHDERCNSVLPAF